MDIGVFWALYFAAGFILFFEGLLGSPSSVRRISKKNPETAIGSIYFVFVFVVIISAIFWPITMAFVLYDYLFNNPPGGT